MELTRTTIYRQILFTCFWVWAVFGFVQDEILPFLANIQSIVFVSLDIILISLGLLTVRKTFDIILGLVFIVISAISTIFVNNLSLANYLNGFREFLPFVFMVPILRYFLEDNRRRDDFIRRIDRQLLIFLIIQVPCVFYQFLKYGANDHGGGSLGNWFSGIISTLIYIITFYLVQKRWDSEHYLKSFLRNKYMLLLLLPSFLNETKVSFVYFAIFFALLFRFDAKLIFKVALASPFIIVAYFFIYNTYMSATKADEESVDLNYLLFEYLSTNEVELEDMILFSEMLEHGDFGDDDDWTVDLPRMTKIALTPEVLSDSNGGLLLGAGLSHFKGGTNVKITAFAKEYHWILNGTQPFIFFVAIQLGLIGVAWTVVFFLSLFGYVHRRKPIERNTKLTVFMGLIVILIFFYNPAYRQPLFCVISFYVIMRTFKCIDDSRPALVDRNDDDNDNEKEDNE